MHGVSLFQFLRWCAVVVRTVHVVHSAIVHDATAVRGHDVQLLAVASFQTRPQQQSERRQQEQQPDDVGDETGNDEEQAGQQQAHTVENFIRGHLSRRHLFLHAAQHTKPFALHENRAQRRHQQKQRDRRKNSEPRPDLDECVDLGEGKRNEDQKEDDHRPAG